MFILKYNEPYMWIKNCEGVITDEFTRTKYLLLKHTQEEPKSGYHVYPQHNKEYATRFPTEEEAKSMISQLKNGYGDSYWLKALRIEQTTTIN